MRMRAMAARGRVIALSWFPLAAAGAVVLAILVLGADVALAQKSNTAIWEPSLAQMAKLAEPPGDETSKSARLRDLFAQFHCNSPSPEASLAGQQVGTNVLCVLPGKGAGQILVTARYDSKGSLGETKMDWWAPAMLPVLYHALQAQPHEHTFVFAAAGDDAGEKALFESYNNGSAQPPAAVVVLDSLGLGFLRFDLGFPDRSKRSAITSLMTTEAVRVADFQGLPSWTVDYSSGQAIRRSIERQRALFVQATHFPAIIFYSDPDTRLPFAPFRMHFEVLASYLNQIDAGLSSKSPPSKQ